MSAKSESVGKRGIDSAFLRLVESEVQVVVDFGVIVSLRMVDGGGYDIVCYSPYAEEGFYCAGRAEQVACHRLGRAMLVMNTLMIMPAFA